MMKFSERLLMQKAFIAWIEKSSENDVRPSKAPINVFTWLTSDKIGKRFLSNMYDDTIDDEHKKKVENVPTPAQKAMHELLRNKEQHILKSMFFGCNECKEVKRWHLMSIEETPADIKQFHDNLKNEDVFVITQHVRVICDVCKKKRDGEVKPKRISFEE